MRDKEKSHDSTIMLSFDKENNVTSNFSFNLLALPALATSLELANN